MDGYSKRPERAVWRSMVRRCTNAACREYPHYGGRGIRACPRWLGPGGFANFLADVGTRPHCLRKRQVSLRRLDNDGDYAPGNVVWAGQRTQMRSCRRNRVLRFGGRSMTLVEWAEHLGVKPATL